MNTPDELLLLDTEELALVQRKYTGQNQLLFAIMLKFFQTEKRYPNNNDVISELLISSLAAQLEFHLQGESDFNWQTRSVERFRCDIRHFLGYIRSTDGHKEQLITHLTQQAGSCLTPEQYKESAYQFLEALKVEPFRDDKLDRCIAIAERRFEYRFFADITSQLSKETRDSFDKLLQGEDIEPEQPGNSTERQTIGIPLWQLKKSIAGAKLKLVQDEIDKLEYLRGTMASAALFSVLNRKLLLKYYTRIMAAYPSDIKKYPTNAQYAMMAIFCYVRSQILTDNSADVLLQMIHKMRNSAETFIDKLIVSEVKCVDGKFDILYSLASITATYPAGVIKDKIYPKVSKDTLENLVKELQSKQGRWYQHQVQTKIHSLYSHGHRNILLALVGIFSFHANDASGKQLLPAIEFIKQHSDMTGQYYPDATSVPIDAVIPPEWHSAVVEKTAKGDKINRINYEIAVLEGLRVKLRCKIIWIHGAYRYRNPQEDSPPDFDDRPEYYYQILKLPQEASSFTKMLKDELQLNLASLNDSILDNPLVKITGNDKTKARIRITPSEAQNEPAYLHRLQQAINKRFSTINLIDILKESDFRINFTNQFHTTTGKEAIDKEKVLKRLLLCLYAIGSNTGVKRVSGANTDSSHSDLRYVKRRYINVENVRAAIVDVVNAIIDIRDPKIWGLATTACSCDSKKISCWDQNLMAEWHSRYRGYGVMIYWHVDQNSACIYSQLKTCSSSEVGSMINGFLKHDSQMNMNKAYMDTHGQSVIGFAVGRLLHFALLPRIKGINKQKLYYADKADKNLYPNLSLILKGSINWKLIEEHYHEVIRYIAALKVGTVEADVLIKHLSSDNYNHPVYKALTEIGNAVKTIFLCKYMGSEELRIEISEALNIVERVNSIMGFIFYGKLGEISTNNADEQELSIVCLHLLQVCMVYINTLLIQEILSDPAWNNKLTKEDKRALSPLIHSHINPYGLFPLDLNQRLIVTKFPIHQNKQRAV